MIIDCGRDSPLFLGVTLGLLACHREVGKHGALQVAEVRDENPAKTSSQCIDDLEEGDLPTRRFVSCTRAH